MSSPERNPFASLSHRELIWLFGILKDACQERLEKNLVSQALEDRLHEQHGELPGRVDPRPQLKEWEPRYRKFLDVALQAQELVRSSAAHDLTEALSEQFSRADSRRAARKGR